ncbi:MAG TPA: ComEC/Rec2 family competence protein, partial [Vicinamibacterales bacterium]|nr:ComEC/Rec2 family competence protein [Vicinamibacterales bacterium]
MPHAAVWPALALAGGIAAGTWSNPDPRIPAGVLVLLTAASGVCLVRKRPLALFVVVIAGWTAAGVSLGSHAEEEARCPAIVSVLEDLGDDALLVVTGRLREDAAWVSSGVALSLAVDALAAGDRTVDVRGGVLLIVSGEPPPSLVHEWTAGRRLRVPATLRRPTRYHNDGVPDHRLASARRGTALLGSVKSAVLVEVLAPGTRFEEWAAAVRQVVRDRVAQTVGRLGTRSSAIVTAVLIGDRAGLDRDVQRRLQEAGTYHVIAISGGNIAIFAVLLLACSRAVRLPWRAGLAVTAAGLVAYG